MFDQMFFDEMRKIIREEIQNALPASKDESEETFLTIGQVQELTTLSKCSIEKLIRNGELQAFYPSERRRTFKKSNVLELMNKTA